MFYCKNCLYPNVAAPPPTFDDNGICSGCRVNASSLSLDWDERYEKLKKLIWYGMDDNNNVLKLVRY